MEAHYETTTRFQRSFDDLDAQKRKAFLGKLEEFIEDLKSTPLGASPKFRPGLRVHPVDKTTDPVTHSMTWAMQWFDGRATFQMVVKVDAVEVTWLDVGGHEIYR